MDRFRYYGESSRPFPSAENSYLVGLCTGSFAAAAISTSQTLFDLVPVAIEAVLLAFRTGLRSLELRDDIEKPMSRITPSWSVIVNYQEAQAVGMIEDFSAQRVRFHLAIVHSFR